MKYVRFFIKNIITVLISLIIVIGLLLVSGYLYFYKFPTQDFQKEIQNLQGIRIINEKDSPIPENDGRKTIEIVGKGLVTFYYDRYGYYRLLMLSDYNKLYHPVFPCKNARNTGELPESQFIDLRTGSPYLKWFPKIESLSELVDKFDSLLEAFRKLPTVSDKNYQVVYNRYGTQVSCDIILRP